jgi:hypothetical protein
MVRNFSAQHASLWTGTAGSWVDLNPEGSTFSVANAIAGNQQVGQTAFEVTARASLWNGTAASWVDLGDGEAWATNGTQQAGTGPNGAALWSGTAASRVDLNPAGSTSSAAYGICGPYQVGCVHLGSPSGPSTASLWTGTAASWENLELALNNSWSNTNAQSVWISGGTLYVAGYGYRNGIYQALLWSRPLPPSNCGSADFNHDGDSGTDADIEAFFACVAGSCCAACGTADFNGDGDVATDADIESFFRVLAGGPC